MIVIGVDVHKQSLTAVAVDEAGRMLDERTDVGATAELVAWVALARRGAAVGGRGLPAADAVRSSGSCLPRVSSWCGCRRS